MKQIVALILITIFFLGCSSNKTTNNDKNQNDSLQQSFVPIINGVWVLKDYINDIEKTKSPLKSADKLQGIVTLIIDGETQKDSIEVGISWNNHEGNSFIAYFKLGNNKSSLKTNIPDYENTTNYYELGYELEKNDTILNIYHYNKTNKLLDKKQFIKVAKKQTDNDVGWGIQLIVNKKILNGDYSIIDSTNSVKIATFKNDGTIIGFNNFKNFYILTDYMGGPETNNDGICFNSNKCFAFETKGDTIYLYNTKSVDENEKLDKLIYKLVKQKK